MLVIPDTNFLIYMAKYRLWYRLEEKYPHYSLLILPQVIYELETLAKKTKGKDKEAALLAFEFIKKIKIKAKKGYADTAILQAAFMLKDAGEKNFVVATMDKALRQKLKRAKIRILTIRQKKYLTSKV